MKQIINRSEMTQTTESQVVSYTKNKIMEVFKPTQKELKQLKERQKARIINTCGAIIAACLAALLVNVLIEAINNPVAISFGSF